MPTLAELQRRLRGWVVAPDGVAGALARGGDARDDAPEAWLLGDASAPAAERLAVYANAYFARIRDALAVDHGALAASLGDDGFHDLVTAYLIQEPPSHFSLRHAGDALPRFLAASPAAAPFRRRWPFAADLARLERACLDAFDAPDAEPLTRAALERLAPERIAAQWLRSVPAAQLLELDPAALAAYEAHAEAGSGAPARSAAAPAAPTEGARARLLVWRRRERVFTRRVAAEEAELLARVAAGLRFAELCEAVALQHGEEAAPGVAAAWLARWLEDELLVDPARS